MDLCKQFEANKRGGGIYKQLGDSSETSVSFNERCISSKSEKEEKPVREVRKRRAKKY